MTSYAIWALNFKSDVRFGLRGHSEVGKACFIFTLKNLDVLNLRLFLTITIIISPISSNSDSLQFIFCQSSKEGQISPKSNHQKSPLQWPPQVS